MAKEIKPIRSRVYLGVMLVVLEPLIVFLAPLRLLDMDMKDMDDIREAMDTGKPKDTHIDLFFLSIFYFKNQMYIVTETIFVLQNYIRK